MSGESWWAKVRETLPIPEAQLDEIDARAEAAKREHVRTRRSLMRPYEYSIEKESTGEWIARDRCIYDKATDDTIACANAVYPEGACSIEAADAHFIATADPLTVQRLVEEIRNLRLIAREMVERCDGEPSGQEDACVFCGSDVWGRHRRASIAPEPHAPGCPWPLLLLNLPPRS
jgi:hypothetical protein